MKTGIPLCVVDNSFLISGILSAYYDDKNNNALNYIEEIISENGQIYVPQLFWFELGNVLVNAAKTDENGETGTISQIQLVEIVQLVTKLPIYTDSQPDSETLQRIITYAQEYNLSFYDATYLELAKRYDIPLKTNDKNLQNCIK